MEGGLADDDDEMEEGEISEDEAGEAEGIADILVVPQLKPQARPDDRRSPDRTHHDQRSRQRSASGHTTFYGTVDSFSASSQHGYNSSQRPFRPPNSRAFPPSAVGWLPNSTSRQHEQPWIETQLDVNTHPQNVSVYPFQTSSFPPTPQALQTSPRQTKRPGATATARGTDRNRKLCMHSRSLERIEAASCGANDLVHARHTAPPAHLPIPKDLMTECTKLIETLHSWGMSVDYMLSQGLDRDLVLHVFHERGYRLPRHHYQYYKEQRRRHQLGHRSARQYDSPNRTSQPNTEPAVISATSTHSRPALQANAVEGHQHTAAEPTGGAVMLSTAPASPVSVVRDSANASILSPRAAAFQPGLDLAEIENRARQALLSRKLASEAKRTAEETQNLVEMEAQISDLLASVSQAQTHEAPLPRDNASQDGEIDMDLESNESIGDVREKLLSIEDDVAQHGLLDPYVSVPGGTGTPTLEHTAVADDSNEPPSRIARPTVSRRPLAIDFEAEPTQALPNVPRWSANLVPSTVARDMVIDLSDSEDEVEHPDIKELRAHLPTRKRTADEVRSRDRSPNVAVGIARPPSANISTARIASPAPTGGAVLEANQGAIANTLQTAGSSTTSAVLAASGEIKIDSTARAQLEAKQAEIRRMTEMIAMLEQKKKRAKARQGSAVEVTVPEALSLTLHQKQGEVPLDNRNAESSGGKVKQQDSIENDLQSAQAAVTRLVGERNEFVERRSTTSQDQGQRQLEPTPMAQQPPTHRSRTAEHLLQGQAQQNAASDVPSLVRSIAEGEQGPIRGFSINGTLAALRNEPGDHPFA